VKSVTHSKLVFCMIFRAFCWPRWT